MEFSMQEYWSGLPLPTLGDFPTQGSNPRLLHWQADSPLAPTGKPHQEDASLQKPLVLPTLLDSWAWSSGVMGDLGSIEDFTQCLQSIGHGREKQA